MWILFGCDHYYPAVDNIIGVYNNKEDALKKYNKLVGHFEELEVYYHEVE